MAVLAVGLLSLGISACLETTSANPKLASASVRSTHTASSPADQVRRRLRANCMAETGGLLGTGEEQSKCDCYANALVKKLRKEDLDFYLTYDLVPTLTVERPDEIKKSCGIKVVDQPGTRGKLASPSYWLGSVAGERSADSWMSVAPRRVTRLPSTLRRSSASQRSANG